MFGRQSILNTEREIQQLAERIDKETDFKTVQREFVARAQKTAATVNAEHF